MIKRRPRRIRRLKTRGGTIFKNRSFQISFLLIFFIAVLFYFLIFFESFQVRSVTIESFCPFPETIKKIVDENLNKKIFGLFDSRSIFFVKLGKIEKLIEERFPEIKKADIQREFFNSLRVNLKLREPIALYCSSGKEACFFIDNEGYLFAKQDSFPESEITIIDLRNTSPEIKKQVLDPETLTVIKTIEKTLEGDMAKPVMEYVIFSSERLDILSHQGWRAYIDPGKKIEIELAKLKFLLEEEISEEALEDIEYIDLRFDRVFYK
jgi:hypothetical protein